MNLPPNIRNIENFVTERDRLGNTPPRKSNCFDQTRGLRAYCTSPGFRVVNQMCRCHAVEVV